MKNKVNSENISNQQLLPDLKKKNGGWSFHTIDTKLTENTQRNTQVREQEAHFNVDRFSNAVFVCCNHQNYITKLKKMKNFHCTEIVYSPQLKILELKGKFKTDNITLRGGSSA